MKQSGRVLVVDDNEDILTSARLLLKKHYSLVKVSDDPKQLKNLIEEFEFDVILLDMNFTQDAISGQEGFHFLSFILIYTIVHCFRLPLYKPYLVREPIRHPKLYKAPLWR